MSCASRGAIGRKQRPLTHTRVLSLMIRPQDGRDASVEPKGLGELGDFPTLLNKKNTPSLRKGQTTGSKEVGLVDTLRRNPEAKNKDS